MAACIIPAAHGGLLPRCGARRGTFFF